MVQYDADSLGLPTGPYYIDLILADDGEVTAYDGVAVEQGQYAGSSWWFDGTQWKPSQQKTSLQQSPLFDVLDVYGQSFTSYARSTFSGTELFGYVKASIGTSDPVLSKGTTNFYLSYNNFQTQGDIKFQNFYNTDVFSFVDATTNTLSTQQINLGYLQKIQVDASLVHTNTWSTVPENSKQYQQISYVYDGTNSPFPIDVIPDISATIPYVKVYQNFKYLKSSAWHLNANNQIVIMDSIAVGDQIDILVYSLEVSKLGFYQVPANLDLNAQNIDINTLTLGQVRNHLVALAHNSTIVDGNPLGQSNLRDIDINQQGGTILQHSSPAPYASLFLLDKQANFVNGVRLAQQEYTKFKNKFVELSTSLPGINPADPAASIDLILTKINQVKNKTFSWYYSDMVPYGPLKNIITYTIFDPLQLNYEITQIFDNQMLSNTAVSVYLNGQQLRVNLEYAFSTNTPSMDFAPILSVDDVVTIYEYSNTDGNYIPETPSKLGLWPVYVPEIFVDDTYRETITVIRGHDGSITPAYGDYRDQFILELELRIYNNIKLPINSTFGDIFTVVPGKFRPSDYSLAEINQLVSKEFLNWIGNNQFDFSTNDTFDSNDPFTWNYAESTDRIDGSKLQGSWRACYQYFYDTFRPHITPWEMLGFASMPDWWEAYYGPGPYTGGNQLLWDDLEAGLIRYGYRAGIDTNYARPGLSQVIPVDVNGFLLSPAQILSRSFSSKRSGAAWSIGQYGPVEFAWRMSSEFPFAVQQALALAKPAKYFGSLIDTYNYTPLNVLYSIDELADGTVIGSEQYLTRTSNHHITQDVINFNGNTSNGTVYRGAGYINWIANYLTNQGINPATYIPPMLQNFQVSLAYKVAGFTDQNYLEVLAEQVSPTSTNASILVPNENYKVYLNKTPVPTNKLIYSAVIVEKTTNGYTVRGYDLFNSFFTIIPSVVNNNATKITVLNSSATIFKDYQNLKLTVPYGYEFTSAQQISDFLVSYERYLISQGFTFDELDPQLSEIRNFKLSVKEFLTWSQQGWKPSSIIVLSPVANTINAISVGSITAGIEDSQYGSKVLDQNFTLVKNNNYSVMRTTSTFKLNLSDPASVIGYIEVDLVQFEHTLIFDNSTVFNDVIYQPESGNRQYRLKLIGQKTAGWDGSLSPAGFIYNSGVVDAWQQGIDYLKGSLVQYKGQYHTALQNVIASTAFQFQEWQQIDANQIQSGLLPNFSTLAVASQSFYDSYGALQNEQQLEVSHALIGFKPRRYLSDLGISLTTQIEFYKGFIKQKGTANAVNEMLTATFNNTASDIQFYEEWAMRVGEYGALDSNPYVEVPLDEAAFGVNPSILQFVSTVDNNIANSLTIFNKQQLHKSYGNYTGNIALNRTENSNYDNDILTAGYVNIDDVDLTIYDLANYVDLDNSISNMGSGYTIWCAKDFSQEWNVYRITETNNHIVEVANSLNGYITFTTDEPHKFVDASIFLVKNFDGLYDGFYQIVRIVSTNQLLVQYQGNILDIANLTTLTGKGILLRLDSVRFTFMEDARIYGLDNPPNGWKVGDKIWIDDDAETTSVQGQPFGTQPNGTWKVYEKQNPWEYNQQLLKGTQDYTTGDGYGTSVKMSADGLIVAVGSPNFGITGSVNTFLKNYLGEFVNSFNILPVGANTTAFGSTVDLATSPASSTVLAVGAPTSDTGRGYVYIYNKTVSSSSFDRGQVLVGQSSDQFGSSIALNQDGSWLYVGAPGNNTMYAYGLNKFVPLNSFVYSAIDKTTLFFSSTITASQGDVIVQPATGARATVLVGGTGVGNLVVSLLTNFIYTPNIIVGNTTISSNVYIYSGAMLTDANIYPISGTSVSITSNIKILSFIPAVTNDPSSLLITTGSKAFIPNVDYYLNGSTVYFITSGNIANPYYIDQDDISIKQQPYYQLIQELPIPTGNGWAQYGYALSSSFGGEQVAVGAPNDTVMGPNNTLLAGAGSVYVWDRVIESFNSITDSILGTSGQDYQTANPIASVRKVTLDNIEVTNYQVIGTNIIRFIDPPPLGRVIFVEVNKFNLLERLIGVDNLEGGLDAIQASAQFGTSLTICSNNCAIYVGAPGYDKGTEYNSGAVWKFHNRGRLYGINTGYTVDPVFTPGDTLRLNDFEVRVIGRLMPTSDTAVDVLTVNTAIRANVGDYITQNSSSANVRVVASTAATGSKHITVSQDFVGANVIFKYSIGNVISINGTILSNYPMASLDSIVQDVNDAGILGVSAVNLGNKLELVSDVKVAKDKLRIVSGVRQPGSQGVYAAADLLIFAYMQIIVNPFGNPGEYFGNKVKLASNAYMLVIGSRRGTTKNFTTFDRYTERLYPTATDSKKYILDTGSTMTALATIFDDATTRLHDSIIGSGSVYTYELYDDPRNAVEHPGRYAFAQQLNPGTLVGGGEFGAALDIEGGFITVSAPNSTVDGEPANSGTVYIFENPTRKRAWELIRYQQPKIDIDSVSRMYLYSTNTNQILTDLQYIDPAKGRILGQAEQELSFKTEYDPAIYNTGFNPAADINPNIYWGELQVGKVWWNLSKVRFIDYEQDTLTYRSLYWGQLFPGSEIEVLEWVQSLVLPSQYISSGFDGVPKYADDSAYVSEIYVNPVTGIIATRYYFWVMDKTSLTANNPTRKISIASITDYIANPKNQGIAYAAVLRNDAIAFYNVSDYLSADTTIVHHDHQLIINTDIIHSEYQLVQKGNPKDPIPTKIANKMIDSLSGIDANSAIVPDPALSVADRYGIDIRPRQSMFVDRLSAVSQMVEYVNTILAINPIVGQYNLAGMNDQDPTPDFKKGEYDQSIDTTIELYYIDINDLPVGYKVLVLNDTQPETNGLWVLYEYQETGSWAIVKVQSYKTSQYWDYTDWYADGFSNLTKPTFSVNTTIDALKLRATSGSIIYINNATGNNTWQLVEVNADSTLSVVGIQNGTIQINPALGDFANNSLGFGNQDFDTNRYDQNPNNELRAILTALQDDIFVNLLEGKFNDLFFVMINYLLTEQNYVDWLFKSSFISVTHKLRTLSQFPSFIVDNQTYYQDYIDEVKPYRSVIREYLLDYTGNDTFGGDITDFDLPAYYDTSTGYNIFRSPTGESPYVAQDEATWQTWPYNQWYDNRTLSLGSITIQQAGANYVSIPTITIISVDGHGSGATAIATVDGTNGTIASITVTNPGSGYTSTPRVDINGSSTVTATAYPVMTNPLIRSFDTAIKFDRTTYTSNVQRWQANTTYTVGQIVSHAQPEGNVNVRKAYQIIANATTSTTFLASDYQELSANIFTNANDRILGFYEPSTIMPVVDNINSKITLANTATSTNTIFVYPTTAAIGMYIGGLGVQSGYITEIISNVDMMIDSLGTIGTVVGNIVSNSSVITGVIGNVSVILAAQNVPGVGYAPGDYVTGSGIPYETFVTSKNITANTLSLSNKSTITANSVVITYGGTPIKAMKITLSANVTLQTNDTINAQFNSLDQLIPGIGFTGVPVTSLDFNATPLFGRAWDINSYDGVIYSSDGIALLSTSAYDTALYSLYNSTLGTTPEDVITFGGDFIDTAHSHAPEELVPGIMFDTLDMRVYTKIDNDANVVAYRVFNNMIGATSYMRISTVTATKLAVPLTLTDSNIYVQNASVLSDPDLTIPSPGVVFINGERVTYWKKTIYTPTTWLANVDYSLGTAISNDSINYIVTGNVVANSWSYVDSANVSVLLGTNVLSQLRRGTQGTGAMAIQPANSDVIDGSTSQLLPGLAYGNMAANINSWYNAGDGITSATDGSGFNGATTPAVEFMKLAKMSN